MNKRIVYTRPDGGLDVVVPAPKARRTGESEETGAVEPESDEAFLARVAAADVPAEAVDVAICGASEIPSDRAFRNAWRRGTSAVVEVDMPAAQEIHMGRIRAARDAELARLDIEQMKGADVAAEKQTLRDLPQTFDLTVAKTPEALKALWPAELPEAGRQVT